MIRNRLYYSLKPLLPPAMRLAVRGWFARRKLEKVRGVWPIRPGSEKPPAGWPGWPDGKQFALVLTHDVEGSAGLAKIPQLMALEQKLGFRSSFNLIPEGGQYTASKQLRDQLTASGFEVGVHDLYHDGKLFLSEPEFRRNAAKINGYLKDWGAAGFRSGFMLRNLDWIHDLNVQYDASTFDTDPFEPQPDGHHTIFPFWVPRNGEQLRTEAAKNGGSPSLLSSSVVNPSGSGDKESSASLLSSFVVNPSGYVELPYTLPQDSTLFLILGERHPDIWFQKLDWIAQHGGMALVNVHPDYVRFPGEPSAARTYPSECYARFLQYARERYGSSFWQPLPRELAAYCRPHLMESVRKAGSSRRGTSSRPGSLSGKHAAVVLYSGYPSDPRPRRELQALLDEGMTADLFCLREDPSQPAREVIGGLTVNRLPIQHERSGKLRYFWQYAAFFLHCFFLLSFRSFRRRYDLVHVHNMPDFLIFSAAVPKLLGARLILDLHDPMPELYQTIYKLREDSAMVRCLKRLEQWSIAFADLVITPNEAFRKLFCSRSCPEPKIRIVMNTPDERIFQPSPPGPAAKPATEFRVMYHGLIVQRHGLDTAIQALAKLPRETRVVLDIYGRKNAYLDEITQRAHDIGLNGRVRYQGQRRIDDIPAAIRETDLGVIPNCRTPFTEINFPTRIFEYLCLDKPVVVPRTKGIWDYFDDSQILYFEPDDPDDLARVIAWAHQHPDETREIMARGKDVYIRHRWFAERENLVASVEALIAGR